MGLFFPNTKPKETNANPRPQEEVLSFWDWFKIVLYTHIPGMDLVMMIYWSISKKTCLTQKYYARALLIYRVGAFILLEIASFIFLKAVGYY